MFHPVVLSLILLLAWREADRLLEKFPAERPAGVVTGDAFGHTYVDFISRACQAGLIIAVCGVFIDSLSPATIESSRSLLFLGGAAFSVMLCPRALHVGLDFAQMQGSGRAEWRRAADYIPSLVLAPLLPATIGALC